MDSNQNDLKGKLNLSVPHAPKNADDLRARLDEAQTRQDAVFVKPVEAAPQGESEAVATSLQDQDYIVSTQPDERGEFGFPADKTSRPAFTLSDKRQAEGAFETSIQDLQARVESLYSNLADHRLVYTDPSKTVTVTADGFGSILEIEFLVSRAISIRLISSALTRSLGEINRLSKQASFEISDAFNLPSGAGISRMLDRVASHNGASLDDPLAQATQEHTLEFLKKVRDLQSSHASRVIEERILNGLGIVKVTISGDPVKVEIRRNTLSDVTLERLKAGVLESLSIVYERAARIQASELEELYRTYSRLIL